MKVYADYAGEFAGLMNNEIDAMDTNLQPTDIAAVQADPTKTTGNVLNTGLQQFDLNDYVAPFNNTSYRQGLSCLVSRNDFINTYFAGGASPAYTPLESQGSWANPAEASLYPEGDYVTAFEYFMASGYPLIEDPNRAGYCTWDFPNSYPTANSSSPAGGWGPALLQDQILFYVRTEFPDRWNQGIYLTDVCTNKFPAYVQALGNETWYTLTGVKLPLDSSGNPCWPELNILEIDTTKDVTSVKVMTYYRFHIYTGAWITGSTPDFLVVWQNYYTPANNEWGAKVYDYSSWDSQEFTDDVDNMLSAPAIGTPGSTNTSEAMYWSYAAQDVLMQDAALIPFYVYSGLSATQTNTYHMINAIGTGFGNWYSWFNAYHVGVATGDVLKWGWTTKVDAPNPISSTWAWDWYYLGEIYDSLISISPYDPADFHTGVADAWSVTAFNNEGNTEFTLHIREDIVWQDLPLKDRSAYTVNFGHEIDSASNVPLTPVDVAFSFEYILADKLAFKQGAHLYPGIYDCDHVVLNPVWKAAWPWYQASAGDPPWYNSTAAIALDAGHGDRHSWQNYYIGMNFVQFDSSIDPNSIKIVLNDPSPWYVYYSDMVAVVIPMHIFEWLADGAWFYNGAPVANVYTMNMMNNGADILYGSGPYIGLGQTDAQTYTLIAYATGATYESTTTRNSYFWQPVRESDRKTLGIDPVKIYYKPATTTVYLQWSLTNYDLSYSYTVDFEGSLKIWTDAGGWSSDIKISQTGIVIGAGGTVNTIWFSFVVTVPVGTQWIVIHKDSKLTITASSGGLTFVDRVIYDSGWIALGDPGLQGIYYQYNNIMKADIAGGSSTCPYYGADGSVGPADLGVLSAQWKKTVSWAPGTNPTDNLHKADINGDGSVGPADLGILSAQWKKNWPIGTLLPVFPATLDP